MGKRVYEYKPEEVDSAQVNIWMEKTLLGFVDEMAKEHQRSRSYWINAALRSWRHRIITERQRRSGSSNVAHRASVLRDAS